MSFESPNFKGRDTQPRGERSDPHRVEANLFLIAMADPMKDREAELTKEAEKKFPKGVDDVRDLYVKDRLALEFPGKCPELSKVERQQLKAGYVRRAQLFWQGAAVAMDTQDEAAMNVLRFYPEMPNDIRALAEQREVSRIKEPAKQGRPGLSLEDNAKLDAWLRLPKGTEKERAALEEKLVKWAKIAGGDSKETETVEEKAERLYPGSKDAQKLFLKQQKGEKLSEDESNLLTVWRMGPPFTKDQVPYSDTWRNDEWLATASGWRNTSDPNYAAKFFDTVRDARLRQLKRDQHPGSEKDTAAEDKVILDGYERFPNNPRGFELYVRDQMAPTKDVGKWKTLTAAERKELGAWDKYTNVWPVSQEEARKITLLDKPTEVQSKMLQRLRGLANSDR